MQLTKYDMKLIYQQANQAVNEKIYVECLDLGEFVLSTCCEWKGFFEGNFQS